MKDFKEGLKDASPIFVFYLCVSFSIGIACADIGLTWFESSLMSMLNLTSAGQFAAIGIMAHRGSFTELALSQLILNIRYLLMSAALLIKLKPEEPVKTRLLMGFGVTDEVFGLSVMRKNPLNPYYTVGAYLIAGCGWVLGTGLGTVVGNILPEVVVKAMSVAIYSMFLTVVIIPATKDKILACVVLVSMLMSSLADKFIPSVPSGIRCVLLTVLLASLAAALFPHTEDENE